MKDHLGNEWIKSDRPLKDYPTGTKAKADGGGYWVKNERGWSWSNSSATFPTPGGDWNGHVSLPKTVFEQLPDGDLTGLTK